MRALLVVNPAATSTTAGGRDVLAHALASDVKLDIVETDRRGHAVAAGRHARREAVDLVVVHGGDGTVNEVVNGMLEHGPGPSVPMLGIVPGGSANVFARALDIPRDPLEATHHLLGAIEERRSRQISLGRADERWFCFNAGLGWDADVVAGVDKRRSKRAGQLLYLRVAVGRYATQLRHRPELTILFHDRHTPLTGQPVEVTGQRLIFVSNTDPWTYLGNKSVRLNPDCSFDGDLALFAVSSLTPLTVAATVWQATMGRRGAHGRNSTRSDNVAHIRVRAQAPVRLQVDGDLVGRRSEVTFSSHRGALSVMV